MAGLVIGAIAALFGLLFVWGFAKNSANIYDGFIFLSLKQLPRALLGFSAEPGTPAIAMAISLAMIACVWFVRNRLFPDFSFNSPRKMNGQYIFSD